MAAPSYLRSPFGLAKRLRIATPVPAQIRTVYQSRQPWHADNSPFLEHYRNTTEDFDAYMSEVAKNARGVTLPAREPRLPAAIQEEVDALRLPRSVQLTYMEPLRRKAKHGIPACDLQLRSYSTRNLEFFADFALRAAYYLNMPARGPVPLPRITERWTVPRSNFVHKKSQENFERRTMRRLIQVQDAHPETVQIWLAYLQKYAFHGVGMKANVFEHSSLEVGKEMDQQADQIAEEVQKKLELVGRRSDMVDAPDVEAVMNDNVFKGAWGGLAPLGPTEYISPAKTRQAN